MRATTFSTAAICSLGVLAAYGISNRVNSNPQPEPEKQPAAPVPVAKLPVAAAITEAVSPPETMAQPLFNQRSLGQARQQREAKLAQSLAQASTPLPVPTAPSLGMTQLPDVKSLPIEQIVAQSVGAKSIQPPARAQLPQPKPQPVAVQSVVPVQPVVAAAPPPVAQPIAQPIAAQPIAQPTAAQPVSSARVMATQPNAALPQTPAHTAPVGRLMASAIDTATQVKSTIPAAATPKPEPQPAATQPAVLASASVAPTPATQSAPQAITQTVAQAQPSDPVNTQLNSQAVSPAIPPQFFTNPTNAAGVDEAYTLGPGDQLALSFFNVPEYNSTQRVLADGTLNLPLVGAVSVSGLTLQQAEAVIAKRYQSELRYAVVTASLAATRPIQVAIVGEVQQPGSYQLASDGSLPGLVQAIQTAGGTTQAADLRTVQVLRPTPTNPSQIIAVNLVDLLQGNLSQDLKLRDGDRILVPTATTVNFAEASQFAASNFAASPGAVDVAIVGEVNRPGAYKIGGEGSRITVSQAIQQAGGIKPMANLRQIQIRRTTRSGADQLIDLDFWQLLQTGNLTQDIALQQGDQITIPTATAPTNAETRLLSAANLSPETIQVNVVG